MSYCWCVFIGIYARGDLLVAKKYAKYIVYSTCIIVYNYVLRCCLYTMATYVALNRSFEEKKFKMFISKKCQVLVCVPWVKV